MTNQAILTEIDALRVADELAAQWRELNKTNDKQAFPHTGLAQLKQVGLMNLLIPTQYGGSGHKTTLMITIAQKLASGCLSTAIIWSMHCQQIAVIVQKATESFKDRYLFDIAQRALYIASVTTEIGSHGDLLAIQSPLRFQNNHIELNRIAPIVTGGLYADAYLISMRASDAAPQTDVKLIFALKSQLAVEKLSNWQTMGMEKTQSAALELTGMLPKHAILNPSLDFKAIAIETMIPLGHFAWAASWLGNARAVFDRCIVHIFRNRKNRSAIDIQSDLFSQRIAEITMQIQSVEMFLNQIALEYHQRLLEKPQSIFENEFQIKINNLKVFSSTTLFNAMDQLITVVGMKFGYLKEDDIGLEQAFRDLRSAELMFHNDRLMKINGKLALFSQQKQIALVDSGMS